MSDGSRMDPLLAQSEPSSDGAGTSGIMYSRYSPVLLQNVMLTLPCQSSHIPPSPLLHALLVIRLFLLASREFGLSKVSPFVRDKAVLAHQKDSPSLLWTVPRTASSHQTTITGLYLILITLTKPDTGLKIGFLSPPGPDSFDLTPGPNLPSDLDSQFYLFSTSGTCLAHLAQIVQGCDPDSEAPALLTPLSCSAHPP
ncbi:hypothetical protein DUI87_08071 [Hirundo rustica rustica]|uniref:Uncharacterized protein n=1 Tax=Hirundo rustica rustica TaxID=333673 RepID=A0A3M0KSG0_HIRRU|nr:hypothetical protein DUI87_08071 [Hirundo rustica rustica]